MSNKFHDLNGLVYYSTKLCNYLKEKFKKIEDNISLLCAKDTELDTKIKTNDYNISINTQDIKKNTQSIIVVDNKVIDLKTKVEGIETTTINGSVINVNQVEQYVFSNVKADDIVTIPNKTGATDFMIECYTDVGTAPEISHTVININDINTNGIVFDNRFVEVTPTGIKPKDTITLNYTKTEEIVDGTTYNYYISDVIPEELLFNLNSITSIEEL